MPPVTRAAALERYRELPLPDTTQEAWRFTDLSGFDPDAFGRNGHDRRGAAAGAERTMLDIDVCRDRRRRRAGDRDRAGARRDHVRAALGRRAARHARRRRRQVHRPQRGLLGARPARPRPEGRRARAAALRPDRELVARTARSSGGCSSSPRRARASALIEEYVVRLARPRRLLERGGRAVRRAGREARVRLAPEPLARDLALRHPSRDGSAATPSSTGSPAASARRRARRGSRTTSPARARPRG